MAVDEKATHFFRAGVAGDGGRRPGTFRIPHPVMNGGRAGGGGSHMGLAGGDRGSVRVRYRVTGRGTNSTRAGQDANRRVLTSSITDLKKDAPASATRGRKKLTSNRPKAMQTRKKEAWEGEENEGGRRVM